MPPWCTCWPSGSRPPRRSASSRPRTSFPAGDPGRETAQIARLRRLAAEAHLDPAFAEKFLNFIIGEVIRHHEAIAEDHEAAPRPTVPAAPPPPPVPPSPQTPRMAASTPPDPRQVTATALGPWPGEDPLEAARIVRGELGSPHLPFLAELPDRGVGSDALGRTASLLVELAVDVQPYGWRIVDRPGKDLMRARSALSTDINVLADVVGAEDTPAADLKVQLRGPAQPCRGPAPAQRGAGADRLRRPPRHRLVAGRRRRQLSAAGGRGGSRGADRGADRRAGDRIRPGRHHPDVQRLPHPAFGARPGGHRLLAAAHRGAAGRRRRRNRRRGPGNRGTL